MKIIRATDMGMCFGVRDALQIAKEIDVPSEVTVYGELVHNPEVNRQLSRAGFHQSSETQRNETVPTPLVMITAHGVSNAARSRLHASGKTLVDTTCPLVRRVHDAVTELKQEGRHILLIGKAGHVEVQGIIEDLDHCDVIGSERDVATYASPSLGVACQTTTPPDLVAKIVAKIRLLNPESDIRFVDTVCRPTKLRQQAMTELLQRVDAVVVVGGHNSNNTRRLLNLCLDHGTRAVHVERASELSADWFDGVQVAGLTAGTSTLDETIDEVQSVMESIAMNRNSLGNCHA